MNYKRKLIYIRRRSCRCRWTYIIARVDPQPGHSRNVWWWSDTWPLCCGFVCICTWWMIHDMFNKYTQKQAWKNKKRSGRLVVVDSAFLRNISHFKSYMLRMGEKRKELSKIVILFRIPPIVRLQIEVWGEFKADILAWRILSFTTNQERDISYCVVPNCRSTFSPRWTNWTNLYQHTGLLLALK